MFAAACCLAAFLLRVLLDPLLQDNSPLILFALAVAVSAIRGFGPGIFATALGSVGSLYFFPPTGSFDVVTSYRPTAVFQIAVFLLVGIMLSWLGGELLAVRSNALQLAMERNDILESITDGFEALDSKWRFLYLNRVAAQMAQTARSEIVGKSVWEEVPEWRGTLVESKFREALNKHEALHFEYLSPGLNKWFEFHAHPAGNGGLTVYFSDISDRKLSEIRLRDALAERDAAVRDVRVLSGLLPICSGCKKIRDDQGDWQQIESYISGHSQAKFSHGLCPGCAKAYYDDLERLTRQQ